MWENRRPNPSVTSVAQTLVCLFFCTGMGIAPSIAQTAAGTPSTTAGAIPGVQYDKALHDMLPPAILAAGSVAVSTTAYTPPLTFYGPDNKQIIGIDADIAAALGTIFGIPFEMTDLGNFAAVVPTLKAKRYDMSIGGFFDTVDNEQQLDFVDFIFDGDTILVQRGNPQNIQSLDDLCGRQVGVTAGTPVETLMQAKSATCKTPIDIVSLTNAPDTFVALRSGRVMAVVGGYNTAVYTTAQQITNGIGLEALPKVRFAAGPLGIVFAKGNDQLRDATAAGLQRIIDSGAYLSILKKWGLETVAIPKATVNGAAQLTASSK